MKIINLLRAEFYKLSKSKAFYVCLLVAICISIISVIIVPKNEAVITAANTNVHQSRNAMIGWMLPNDAKKLKGLWFMSSCLGTGDILPIIVAIMISIFITKEFQSRAINNIVSKGFSKNKVYFSKLISVSLCTIFILGVYMAVAAILASAWLGFGEFNIYIFGEIIRMLLLQILLHVSIASIFTMIAMIVRKSGPAIAINICINLFVSLFYQLIVIFLNNNITVGQYWISYNILVLEALEPEGSAVIRGIMVALTFFVLSTMIGCINFNKRDI